MELFKKSKLTDKTKVVCRNGMKGVVRFNFPIPNQKPKDIIHFFNEGNFISLDNYRENLTCFNKHGDQHDYDIIAILIGE